MARWHATFQRTPSVSATAPRLVPSRLPSSRFLFPVRSAICEEAFAREIVPTWGRDEEGRRKVMNEDQCIRRDTTLEALVR